MMNERLTQLLTYLLYYYYTPKYIHIINLVNPLFNSCDQKVNFGLRIHCFQKWGSKGSFTPENDHSKRVHGSSEGSLFEGSP